jgi:catechol 2,3-dioxygenase-like lactoylglutathione lyase family enzyme
MSSLTERGVAQITRIAPQFLVGDLERSIAYYRDQLGFTLDFVYESFYASVSRDGCAIHLKHGPRLEGESAFRRQHEHLDAYVGVSGVRDLFGEMQRRGANIITPLEEHPWNCLDFYVEDADGYILCFSELTA